MASPNFLELQNRVIARNYGEVDRTNIKTFLNEANEEVQSRRWWSWAMSTAAVTTTAGNPNSSLPINNILFGRISPNQDGIDEPIFVDQWAYSLDSPTRLYLTGQGAPVYFTLEPNIIHWRPTPDATYSYTLYYWLNPVTLTNDSDEPLIPARLRDVLVWGAMMKLSERDRDYAAVQFWSTRFEDALAKMKSLDTTMAQRHTPTKVPMPPSYMGRFDRG